VKDSELMHMLLTEIMKTHLFIPKKMRSRNIFLEKALRERIAESDSRAKQFSFNFGSKKISIHVQNTNKTRIG